MALNGIRLPQHVEFILSFAESLFCLQGGVFHFYLRNSTVNYVAIVLFSLEEVTQGEWGVDEVAEKLHLPAGGNNWKLAFREGVDLDERIFTRNHYRENSEDMPYIGRYDLTYLTPCHHQLLCKVRLQWDNAKSTI